jgi:hypothetical protein
VEAGRVDAATGRIAPLQKASRYTGAWRIQRRHPPHRIPSFTGLYGGSIDFVILFPFAGSYFRATAPRMSFTVALVHSSPSALL